MIKRKTIIYITAAILITALSLTAYAGQSATYKTVYDEKSETNCERFVTVNLNGGSTTGMYVRYCIDHGGAYPAGQWYKYDLIVEKNLLDKYGKGHLVHKYTPAENLGSRSTFTDTVSAGVNYQHHDCVGNTPYIFIKTPTKYGYTFDGWQTNGTSINELADAKLPLGRKRTDGYSHFQAGAYMRNGSGGKDITITATWKPWKHTVAYNANGGTGAPGTQTKIYGAGLNLSSSKPTRVGYTFKGWNTEQNGSGTAYGAGAVYGADRNGGTVTLYAQWTVNACTLTIDYNGGSYYTRDPQTGYGSAISAECITRKVNYNSQVMLSVDAEEPGSYIMYGMNSKPLREGYTFDGWKLVSGMGEIQRTVSDSRYYGQSGYIFRNTDPSAGVRATVQAQWIMDDNKKPDITIDEDGEVTVYEPESTEESHVIGWVNHDVSIKVTGTDSQSGVAQITLRSYDGSIYETEDNMLSHRFSEEGITGYYITVSDNMGNIHRIDLTVKIDKTAPVIIGETEPAKGKINHTAEDICSGLYTYKLYDDTGMEITQQDGLLYDTQSNTIEYDSSKTYCLYWKLEAYDNAGNVTVMKLHTPYNFTFRAELDNLRENTENFLVGEPAKLHVWTYGYVETVEIQFDNIVTAHAEHEGNNINATVEQGNAYDLHPVSEEAELCHDFVVPKGIGTMDDCRVRVRVWRDGHSREMVLRFKTVTERDAAKEFAKKIRRRIISSTWEIEKRDEK